MTAGFRSRYPRLSPADGWLLSASTQSNSAAKVAWDQWRAQRQVETADFRSQAMFGILYANLIADLGGPDAKKLKGVYKRTWYANQLLLAQLRPLLDRLAAEGISAAVMNDASLVGGHYPDIGYRAIRCIDFLVHGENWERSVKMATEAGWKAQQGESFSSPTSLSITQLLGPEGQSLLISTRLFTAEPRDYVEARIWDDAQTIEISGQPVLTLGTVEQLLSLSVEALRGKRPPLFPYADAMLLLDSLTSTADWTRLVWRAQRFQRILPLRSMLAFLHTTLGVRLPAWVLPELNRMAISHWELLHYNQVCDSVLLRFKSACLRCLRELRSHSGPRLKP